MDKTQTYIPAIPSAFINHKDVKWVLNDTINDFHHDEKEAIFFYCVLGVGVKDISKVTRLTSAHVTSALNLYAARLESKLCFFKKFVPHNDEESLPAGELLFLDNLA
ncbi:MAG: hypothetical protein FWC71_06890 [Defluviitaleaceae bacterium]|nr:hypothetical protein [Defluviitaleaceae bacterium]